MKGLEREHVKNYSVVVEAKRFQLFRLIKKGERVRAAWGAVVEIAFSKFVWFGVASFFGKPARRVLILGKGVSNE